MANDTYNIYCRDKLIHSNLTEEEYFNIMENLSQDFYLTGTPYPEDLRTEVIGD
jgi:hypothetical protein